MELMLYGINVTTGPGMVGKRWEAARAILQLLRGDQDGSMCLCVETITRCSTRGMMATGMIGSRWEGRSPPVLPRSPGEQSYRCIRAQYEQHVSAQVVRWRLVRLGGFLK